MKSENQAIAALPPLDAARLPDTPRQADLDQLKALAILGVLLIHVASRGYTAPVASPDWLGSLFWGALARGSVPVFLMCSGALLLDPKREMTMRHLFGRSLARLVCAMLFWAMAYQLYHLWSADALDLSGLMQAGKDVLCFRQEFHFYYIHIMLLVYLFLPVTRGFVRQAGRRALAYLLALWLVLGILYPTVKSFPPFSGLEAGCLQWLMNMRYAAIGYGVLGYYLRRYPLPVWTAGLCVGAGFAFTFGGTVWMSEKQGTLYTGFLEGMSLGPMLLAVGVFALVVGGKPRLPARLDAAVRFVSKGSFCVYLVHVFGIYGCTAMGLTVFRLPCLLSVPLLSALILAGSLCVYAGLRCVPVVRRWLI